MGDEYITTASGAKYKSDYFVSSEDYLSLAVLGEAEETVEKVFSDPTETAVLTYAGMVREGYTTMVVIKTSGDAVRVLLRKGE